MSKNVIEKKQEVAQKQILNDPQGSKTSSICYSNVLHQVDSREEGRDPMLKVVKHELKLSVDLVPLEQHIQNILNKVNFIGTTAFFRIPLRKLSHKST